MYCFECEKKTIWKADQASTGPWKLPSFWHSKRHGYRDFLLLRYHVFTVETEDILIPLKNVQEVEDLQYWLHKRENVC